MAKFNKVSDCEFVTSKAEAGKLVLTIALRLLREDKIPLKRGLALTKRDIGYYAGYLSEEAFYRILDLFETEHPVFGKTLPDTPMEAFKMDIEYARNLTTNEQ